MRDEEKESCPQCGEPLTREAPGGLCPRCVMAMNLSPDTMENDPGPIPAVEALAPHFPQLEILECLGRGGMGIVYQARQPQLDRFVALKILAPDRVHDVRFEERFRREGISLARLDHPNIVTVYDTGESGGFYYLLMEFVDGLNLREAVAGEKMSAQEALAIVPPICAGLQYAHEHGVVHRDIKPENILLDKKGRVKIADFGVAKLVCGSEEGAEEEMPTAEIESGLTMGGKLGTPQYMAPEQEEKSKSVDHRADIYALGVVFYEMLTGERPEKELVAPSRKVEVDVRIDEIVLRALEKEPAKRYQSAGEFRTVVETMAGASASPSEATEAQAGEKGVRMTPLFPGLLYQSRAAVRLAQVGWGLGCLGALGFLGSIPGLHAFKAFFGFAGFFGLIGVAVMVEFICRKRSRSEIHGGGSTGMSVWGIMGLVVGFGLILLVGALATYTIYKVAGSGSHQDVATLVDSPQKLRKVTTDQVIEAGLSKTLSPWAWQELERRELSDDEVARLMNGLTEWVEREHPSGMEIPMSWLDQFLHHLYESGRVDEAQAVRFVEAVQGKVRVSPLPRIREGAKHLSLSAEWRYVWEDSLLGLQMMNELRGAKVDGQPVELPPHAWIAWKGDRFSQRIALPDLEPGRHELELEVFSALVSKGDLRGLARDAESGDWPPAKKRWTRRVKAEFVVAAGNAEVVAMTKEPKLDPMVSGGLSIKEVVIQSDGEDAVGILPFQFGKLLPVSVSFDVSMRIDSKEFPCGVLWAARNEDGRLSPRSSRELRVKLGRLDAGVRKAVIILKPNVHPIEHVAQVDRIWGGEVVLRDLPLRRLDLPAGIDELPAGSSIKPAEFGEMMERTLERSEALKNCFLDIESGQVLSAPDSLVESLRSKGQLGHGGPHIMQIADWARRKGVDFWLPGGDESCLTLLEGICIQGKQSFADRKAAGVQADMEVVWKEARPHVEPGFHMGCRFTPEYHDGTTWVFRTREGTSGMLTIIPGVKSGAVKVRFKAVTSDVPRKENGGGGK